MVMMGGNADDPGYHMLTVTDIMVYFDNCKKVGLNVNMGNQICLFFCSGWDIVHDFFLSNANLLSLQPCFIVIF